MFVTKVIQYGNRSAPKYFERTLKNTVKFSRAKLDVKDTQMFSNSRQIFTCFINECKVVSTDKIQVHFNVFLY